MKKHMILPIVALLLLCGCRRSPQGNIKRTEPVEGRELYCLAESEEEAKSIADMYQIELIEWGDGVAVFHTENDPQTVIDQGIKNQYPRLSLNTKDNKLH